MLSDRVTLCDVVPLSTPFSLQIYPTYFCNFNCNYCFRNTADENLKNRFYYNKSIDLSIFKKAIDGAKSFIQPLKTIVFTGGGDPLMHNNIIEMIEYASAAKISERIELLTNGARLTPEFIDKLISAGLTKIRISIQGVDAARYKEICGVDIDFYKFVSNLKYLYENKKNMYVYIKIIDSALRSKTEEDIFHSIFDPLADETSIEYLVPLEKDLDYNRIGKISGNNQQTGHSYGTDICSLPFFMCLLYPDGSISPCCGLNPPIIGNVLKNTLPEIWSGEKHRELLIKQLSGFRNIPICHTCQTPCYQINPSDYLDEKKDIILKKLTV